MDRRQLNEEVWVGYLRSVRFVKSARTNHQFHWLPQVDLLGGAVQEVNRERAGEADRVDRFEELAELQAISRLQLGEEGGDAGVERGAHAILSVL